MTPYKIFFVPWKRMSFLIAKRIDICILRRWKLHQIIYVHELRNAISNGQQITCVLMCALPREHLNTRARDTRDTKSAFNLGRENFTNNKWVACMLLTSFQLLPLCTAHRTKKGEQRYGALAAWKLNGIGGWCAVVYFSFIAYTLHISVAFFLSLLFHFDLDR